MLEIRLERPVGPQIDINITLLKKVGDRDPSSREVVLTYLNGQVQVVLCSNQEYTDLTTSLAEFLESKEEDKGKADVKRDSLNNEKKLASGLSKRETFILAAISGGKEPEWASMKAEGFIKEYGE